MRAFVAVDATSSALGELQKDMMGAWSPRDVKPVEAHNFHFTLIFLGEISEQQALAVREALSAISFEPFSLTYTGVGAFPRPGNARVVWVGVDREGGKKLEALAQQVVVGLEKLGFKPDRPFSPHLTIFRAKNRHVQVGVEKYAGRTFGTEVVDRVHLKKSDLAPSGPTYSNVYTVSAVKEEGK
ncbi:MAG: RNA 2',3'-cyclic phosphodiesterase [Nitrososphaera sp.]|uniref:RNA 2',3'-cyclic phosphodiesterase n=1 Tax=Nitrososphaera sp. TaxID=1971748 RepID=UPI00182F302E|nr:RNA 2',3'-cyclic phosphodiesterase [Nitrososphaera sp.]NWG38153.1 RNA 2',3'-cyclic phosphodiesterase [Nitrososphaera sp.]